MSSAKPEPKHWFGPTALIYALLALLVGVVYWRVISFDFVNIDDWAYVKSNTNVQRGLTWANLRWAMSATYSGNWHPLTTISHMIDCEFFGLNAGMHHLTSVLFHIANTSLLFLVLRSLTRFTWRSALVAALFALHPLHVESVAWISERKDVLSAFFFFLTLGMYAGYAGHAAQQRQLARRYYIGAVVWFALGLLSKPMVVTLPFVLLLLDYWPLRRIEGFSMGSVRPVLLEKLPFLFLSGAASIVTFLAQRSEGAVIALDAMPLHLRFENALVSYAHYLVKTVWPEPLAVFYPYSDWPIAMIIASGLLLMVITFAAIWNARSKPYIFVGWLWFVGMLVPVIGIVQVGNQAMADRYSYLPLIGIFFIAVWGGADLLSKWRHKQLVGRLLVFVILVGCMVKTSAQLRYWKNSETLFAHAALTIPGNAPAHYYLGRLLESQNDPRAALEHYRQAVAISPRFPEAHYSLAELVAKNGNTNEAKEHYNEALKINPRFAEAHYQLAMLLSAEGDMSAAIEHLRLAVWLRPDWVEALNNLAWIRATHPDERFREGGEAVRLAAHAVELTGTNNPGALDTLAAAYAEMGDFSKATESAHHALNLATTQPQIAGEIASRLDLYRSGKPFREQIHVKSF